MSLSSWWAARRARKAFAKDQRRRIEIDAALLEHNEDLKRVCRLSIHLRDGGVIPHFLTVYGVLLIYTFREVSFHAKSALEIADELANEIIQRGARGPDVFISPHNIRYVTHDLMTNLTAEEIALKVEVKSWRL